MLVLIIRDWLGRKVLIFNSFFGDLTSRSGIKDKRFGAEPFLRIGHNRNGVHPPPSTGVKPYFMFLIPILVVPLGLTPSRRLRMCGRVSELDTVILFLRYTVIGLTFAAHVKHE